MTIVSGSGSTWTLSQNLGTIASESMSSGNGPNGYSSPNAPGPALTITESGPFATFPITNYSTGVGTITISGTYKASALGAPTAIQAQISATPGGAPIPGFSWAKLSNAILMQRRLVGDIAGVPAGGPYYVSVRATNGKAYTTSSSPYQVGLVIAWIGQSQQAFMWAPADTGNALAERISNLTAVYGAGVYADLLTYSLNGWRQGAIAVRQITPQNTFANIRNILGDGIIAFVDGLEALSGWPVEVINMTRVGTPSDAWADDFVTQTKTTSGSGAGPYAMTAAFSQSSLPGAAGGANLNRISGATQAILAGSMQFIVGSTLAAVDLQALVYGTSSSTDCAGKNGFVVSSCSINYTTGAVSITFSAAPASAPTAKWVNLVDYLDTGAYDGYGWFGDGGAESGVISGIMAKVPGAINAVVLEQCTSNAGEFGAYLTAAPSLTAKWSYILANKYPGTFSQWGAPTIVALGYPHDESLPPAAGGWSQITDCVQWTRDFAVGAVSPTAFPDGYAYGTPVGGASAVAYGGAYQDDAVQIFSLVGDNPHPTSGTFGGQRIGRRAAANTWAALRNNASLTAEPHIGAAKIAACDSSATASPCFDTSTTYNAACSGAPGTGSNCIDIIFSLNATNATALATCGTNLSGGAYPPTGTCSGSTSIGQTVEGFRIGTSSNPALSGDIYDDGFDPIVGGSRQFSQSNAFTCTAGREQRPLRGAVRQGERGMDERRHVPHLSRWRRGVARGNLARQRRRRVLGLHRRLWLHQWNLYADRLGRFLLDRADDLGHRLRRGDLQRLSEYGGRRLRRHRSADLHRLRHGLGDRRRHLIRLGQHGHLAERREHARSVSLRQRRPRGHNSRPDLQRRRARPTRDAGRDHYGAECFRVEIQPRFRWVGRWPNQPSRRYGGDVSADGMSVAAKSSPCEQQRKVLVLASA